MAILCDFHSHRPPYRISNSEAASWLASAHGRAEKTRSTDPYFSETAFTERMHRQLLRFGPGSESVACRGHHLEDYGHHDWERMAIHRLHESPNGEGIGPRMEKFSEISAAVLEEIYPEDAKAPDDIIHVTCTGYVAPSAAQNLVVKRGWSETTRVLHAYHMGCYAALPAVRIASGLLTATQTGIASSRVDIVHNEVCTLHLDPGRHEAEQLVVQSLFGDGHIRYSVLADGEDAAGVRDAHGLEVLAVQETLVPDSANDMTWIPGSHGMRMSLSREVPEHIAGKLREFVQKLYALGGYRPAEVWSKHPRTLFAVHPGGPRIIDSVAALLELKPDQVEASRRVLKNFGNMSSATAPHIWMDMLHDDSVAAGTRIISLAFGPGLTIHGCLLRKIR